MLAIVRQLSRAQSQEEIMTVVRDGVRRCLHADGATFVLRDGNRCYYADEDAVSPLWRGRRFPASAEISGWCIVNHQSAAVADIFQDARVSPQAYRPSFVRSLAMAPVGHSESIAALGAYWSELHEPQPVEVEHLQAIADATGLAVINVQLQQAASSKRPGVTSAPARKACEPRRSSNDDRPSLRSLLERLFRDGLRPDSPEAYAFAVLCVLAATLLPLGAAAIGLRGLPTFESYYPAVLLATLLGGGRSGVLAAVVGGLAANYFFMPPIFRFVWLDASDFLKLSLYAISSGLIILIIGSHQRAVLRLKQEDAEHLTLAREQHHRALNAVVMVETIVRQSLRDDLPKARVINHRIRTGVASISIDLPTRPITILALLTEELECFNLSRFTFNCDDQTLLAPKVTKLLALAAHELATNASKYGALSGPRGRVTVTGRVLCGRVTISWLESGGPSVQPPQNRGYGTIMLHRLIEAAGGAIALEFPPTGVVAEISLALEPDRRG